MRYALITRPASVLKVALASLLISVMGVGTAFAGPTAPVDAARSAARSGRPVIVWKALPSTWQSQGDELVHEVAKAVPADLYDKGMETMGKLFTVLKTKKKFVLGSSMTKAGMAEMTPAQKQQLLDSYDEFVVFGKAVTTSSLSSSAKLSKATVSGILSKIGPSAYKLAMTGMAMAADQSGPSGIEAKAALDTFKSMKDMKAKVVSQTGDNAVIAISMPGIPQSVQLSMSQVPMSKVAGSWVPTPMVAQWPEYATWMKAGIAQMAQQFAAGNPKAQQAQMMMQMGIGMVETSLDAMAKATTQKEFDQAVAGLASFMGGMGS